MELTMNKDINYYMNLPYTRELIREQSGIWFVQIKELPGCMSQGSSPEEALRMIDDAMRGWLKIELEDGESIPEPKLDEEYSGKFVVRVPKSLHHKLSDLSEADDVSLNQWIVSALAEAVGGIYAVSKSSKAGTGQKNAECLMKETSNAIHSILGDVGMQLESDASEEQCFAIWLGKNLSDIRLIVQAGDTSQAISLCNTLSGLLNEYKNQSPIMQVFYQMILEQTKVIEKTEFLAHKVSESEKLHLQIRSLIDTVNSPNIFALQTREFENFFMKAEETEDRYDTEEAELTGVWDIK